MPYSKVMLEKINLHKKTCVGKVKAPWQSELDKINVVRSDKWDAYGCLDCGEWLQPKCSDKNCEFCVDRPEKFEGP